MKTKSQNTYHIVRHVGKQGTHPPKESSKSGVGKCTTVLATSLEKEVMYAFHMSLEKPIGTHTENTFRIGRSWNHNVRWT